MSTPSAHMAGDVLRGFAASSAYRRVDDSLPRANRPGRVTFMHHACAHLERGCVGGLEREPLLRQFRLRALALLE
eukprot:2476848-Pyramimonas_sp.AAC.1